MKTDLHCLQVNDNFNLNFYQQFIVTMKQHPLKASQYKVNFRYTNSPSRREPHIDNPIIVHHPSNYTTIGKEVNAHRIANSEFSSSKTSQSVMNTEQTLKKEGLSLEAVTLRKEANKKNNAQLNDEVDLLSIDTYSQQNIAKTNEMAMLKDEIRYMRKNLIDAQNAEKALKLEFELYKASAEMTQEQTQSSQTELKSSQNAEIQSLLQQLSEKEKKILEQEKENTSLHNLLFQQTKKSTLSEKELKDKIEQNKQLVNQTREMYNEIQLRCTDLNNLNQDLITICQTNEQFYNENNYLKGLLTDKDKAKEESEKVVFDLKEKCLHFEEQVYKLESQVENFANTINQLKIGSELNVHRLDSDLAVLHEVEEKMKGFAELKERLENQLTTESKEHATIKSSLQVQNFQLRSESMGLHSSLNTLLSNQRIMLSEIQWLRSELNGQVNKYQIDFQQMQEKHRLELEQLKNLHQAQLCEKDKQATLLSQQILKINNECEEMTVKYEENLNSIMDIHQKQIETSKKIYEEEYERKLQQVKGKTSLSKIEAQPLSTEELQKHLQLLKAQPEQLSEEQYEKTKQESDILRQQLQLSKVTHDLQMQHLRERYEMQIHLNNEQYTHQLSIYMKEVEILMEEMDKLKEKKEYCQEIIEEEAEQLEYDDDKIKNDLRLYGDDSSDIYMSPPSNAPSKPYIPAQQSNAQTNPQYMLNQIIDLDSKINNYIVNFNKMRQAKDSDKDDANDV